MKTIFNSILIFKDGELYKRINYKTKRETLQNYVHFTKNGYIDANTGLKIENLTFKLL